MNGKNCCFNGKEKFDFRGKHYLAEIQGAYATKLAIKIISANHLLNRHLSYKYVLSSLVKRRI